MAKGLLERLQKDEAEWRKVSPEWDRKYKGWQAWEAGAKERERAAQRAAAKTAKAEGDKMDRLQAKAAVNSGPYAIYASFDPDAPSEEFCFTSWSTRYSPSELEDDIKEIEKWTTTPKFLLECLKRGIAIHHSGLNKRYRALVESLFRIGFCKVVISTGA
jgi:ATP-dependent RNA helicase DDX60